MAITAAQVVARTKTKDPLEVIRAEIATAGLLLDGYIEDALLIDELQVITTTAEGEEVSLYDAAHFAVVLALYAQRKALNGTPNQQYNMDGVTPLPEQPVNRDPLAGAYPLLRDFVSPVRFA